MQPHEKIIQQLEIEFGKELRNAGYNITVKQIINFFYKKVKVIILSEHPQNISITNFFKFVIRFQLMFNIYYRSKGKRQVDVIENIFENNYRVKRRYPERFTYDDYARYCELTNQKPKKLLKYAIDFQNSRAENNTVEGQGVDPASLQPDN